MLQLLAKNVYLRIDWFDILKHAWAKSDFVKLFAIPPDCDLIASAARNKFVRGMREALFRERFEISQTYWRHLT